MADKITDFTNRLLELVGKDQIDDTIKILQQLFKNSPTYTELILHSARYHSIIKDVHLGLLNPQESQGEKTKIRQALIYMINELKENVQNDRTLITEIESFIDQHQEQLKKENSGINGLRNDLYTRQVEPGYVKLLAAQKQIYIEGKRIKEIIFFASLFTAVIFPILLKYFPNHEPAIGILGGLISIAAAYLLPAIPSKKAATAANIQEEFDTKLYKMEWNQSLAGNKVSKREIERANKRLKDRSNIDDSPWYQDYRNMEHSQAVLHCMQENLYWDRKQKMKYATFLGIVASCLFVLGWIWGFEILELHHLEYLAGVFFPFSGFLMYLIQTIWRSHASSIGGMQKESSAQILSEKYQGTPFPIPDTELRNLQDAIYTSRKTGDLVPEWFYNLFKESHESALEDTASDLNQ
ncbi:MAG: S-4TM family putative pore-forming effector [Bacteroidota bacterium]